MEAAHAADAALREARARECPRHAPSWMEEYLGLFAGWQGRALASRDGLRGAGFDEGLDGFVPGFDEFEMAYDPWGRTWGLARH